MCKRCRGTGWVCESHADKPWNGSKACGCGGAGMPCPQCCMDADWNADPDRAPDVSKVFSAVIRAGDNRFRVVK